MIRVLFESHHLYYLPNFIPIIDEMKSRGHYEIVASIPAQMTPLEQKTFYDACNDLGILTIRKQNEESRIQEIQDNDFQIVMVGNVGQLNKVVKNHTLSVMVYHGIGLKQSYYSDIDPRIDIRAVESESRLAELEKHGHCNLVLTGYTKCDPLASSLQKLNNELMELNRNQKTVLYAPSFYPSSIDQLFPVLGKISYETNIIVKLHNFSWYQERYKYQSKSIKKLADEFENIHLLPPEAYNIIPYYKLADILVSDISSTIFEYLYLNRPIIMAKCLTLRLKDKLFNKRFLKKMDIQRMEGVDFTYQLEHAEDLPSLVYHGLEFPSDLNRERKNAQTEYLYMTDGKASSRLVDAVESRLEKSSF